MTQGLGGLAAIIALLAGLCAPAHAAEPLFQPAPDVRAASPATSSAGRSRLVRLSLATRAARIGPSDADRAADRADKAAALDPDLTIEFFPDVRATFRRTAVRAATGGGYVWSGRAGERGAATLVVDGDAVSGYAEVDDRAYRIEPVSGTLHRIVEIDPSRDKPDIVRERPPAPGERARPERRGEGAEPDARLVSTITLLVAYTPAAQAMAPRIAMDIDLAVELANEAYKRSGVPIELVLAGSMKVAYDEGDNWDRNLQDLTDSKRFAAVRRKRNKVKADLVTLLRGSGSFCGIAWYTGEPSKQTADQGFSVVSRDCIANHSVAHELGHNLGLHHDHYVDGKDGGFNYGYVNLKARIRSIMAYDDRCRANGFSCTRVNMFSTPRRDYKDQRIGVAAGNAAADSARRLKQTRKIVSQYR